MMIYNDFTELIGSTPLLYLNNIAEKFGCCAKIAAKLERQNPAGSAKDRVALNMILRAEESGELIPGGTIIEVTSGNTGIGLAAVSAVRGYDCIIVMPDSMSPERIKLIEAYGAQVVLTPGAEGMQGAMDKAEEIMKNRPGCFAAAQFKNEANPEAHYLTTGPEIWRDSEGEIDIYVACVGTGGTLTGTGRYLREQKSDVKIVAVEPDASPVLSGGEPGAHKIQGIGPNFIPPVLDAELFDEVYRCGDNEAFDMMRTLAKTEGILCGMSSGAALAAAVSEAKKKENEGKLIVCLLPDTGERYLSVF
ncbi:MAG: cysteine synthase A [Oscillospiraceae bacterium]|nr:cysteine synthase A [Oscillospiraceae bacterium]